MAILKLHYGYNSGDRYWTFKSVTIFICAPWMWFEIIHTYDSQNIF